MFENQNKLLLDCTFDFKMKMLNLDTFELIVVDSYNTWIIIDWSDK